MDADLDLLLTAVYVTADDLLPARPGNARRSVTDAEVVTLCVAQAIMGIPSDRRFLAVASKHLSHLFPRIPGQAGYYKRRRRLADTLEWHYDIKFVMDQVGHADSKMTMDVYNQLQQRAKREHGASFDRLIRQAREQFYGDAADARGVLDNVLDNGDKPAPEPPKTRPTEHGQKPRISRSNAARRAHDSKAGHNCFQAWRPPNDQPRGA